MLSNGHLNLLQKLFLSNFVIMRQISYLNCIFLKKCIKSFFKESLLQDFNYFEKKTLIIKSKVSLF